LSNIFSGAVNTFDEVDISSNYFIKLLNSANNAWTIQDAAGQLQLVNGVGTTVTTIAQSGNVLISTGGLTVISGGITVSTGGLTVNGGFSNFSMPGGFSGTYLGAMFESDNSVTGAGYAVRGQMLGAGNTGVAVLGVNSSTSTGAVAVQGSQIAASGTTYGVYGAVSSPAGYAGFFRDASSAGTALHAVSGISTTLDVVSNMVKVNGLFDISSFLYQDGNQGTGKVLTSDTNGYVSWQSSASGTIIATRCGWITNNVGWSTGAIPQECSPAACPTGFFALVSSNNVVTGAAGYSGYGPNYTGYSEIDCSTSATFKVLYTRCGWITNNVGWSTGAIPQECSPPGCPAGWTQQGSGNNVVTGAIAWSAYGPNYTGYSENICTQ
jgi:hypothetical protein